MADIKLDVNEREAIRSKLVAYCEEHFDLELEQFDAEFFTDYVIETLGIAIYNAGVDEAIRTHQAYSERIQEEIELKKIV
ncbi:MAG: DUF2164 family protein [Leclercia sp.]|jgi:uncharacterized protein (DUF2164 family)